ncbi:FecR family protein [Chitinophaga polysaccharea]|uniref:FecR family protein n=1 Tax=Chitinophaga polysaccharea TaxID=1293035 RepID=UPI00115BA00A|nr:FecR family protein [Chitinophaga polysaccharea]
MERNELAILSKKYLAGAASDEEKDCLLQWYNAYDEEALTAYLAGPETEADLEQRMRHRLMAATAPEVRVVPIRRSGWKAAAAVLVLVTAGAGFYMWQSGKKQVLAEKAVTIMPGADKATLTLADGTVVNLDSAGTGVLTVQGNSKVEKTMHGQIVYKSSNADASVVSYNVLRTPRGGQYKITLPDGTDVWLNANSSVSYPTAFNGKEREVGITGEVYFEVAADVEQPFRVKVNNNMDVMVLGTHFNINAYPDESTINTTLLEGAVLVKTTGAMRHLSPGQQAKATPAGDGIVKVGRVDVNSAIAWKNGYFSFEDADIPTVMRQLSRWYNIEVKYSDKIPEETFTGEIGRSLTQEQLLKVLSQAKINFKVEEGRRIIIYP